MGSFSSTTFWGIRGCGLEFDVHGFGLFRIVHQVHAYGMEFRTYGFVVQLFLGVSELAGVESRAPDEVIVGFTHGCISRHVLLKHVGPSDPQTLLTCSLLCQDPPVWSSKEKPSSIPTVDPDLHSKFFSLVASKKARERNPCVFSI